MATFTENYNLIKPGEEDYYDVQDFNENMDTIDAQMLATEQEINSVSEKIGNADDSGTSTVFGMLNQLAQGNASEGLTAIKSIQRIVYEPTTNNGATLTINPVDPTKCIVYFERIKDHAASERPYVDYTLNSNSLVIDHGGMSVMQYGIIIGFWIIEFC